MLCPAVAGAQHEIGGTLKIGGIHRIEGYSGKQWNRENTRKCHK